MKEESAPESAAPRDQSRALRILVAVVVLSFLTTLGHELLVPRQQQWSTRSAVFAIEQYRRYISPRLKGRITCRFEPTCSAYGLAAVKKYGGVRGSWRAVKRIARCNPMTKMGTVDLP
jgi:uncharacterized protein